MRKLLLDTDAIDAIDTMPGLYQKLQAATEAGHVELILTHVQVDQLVVMADAQQTGPKREKRGRLLALLASLPNVRHVPTTGFVIGVSRIGLAKLAAEDDSATAPVFAKNPANAEDVLLINTALDVDAEFVSADRKARVYAAGCGLVAVSPAELLASL